MKRKIKISIFQQLILSICLLSSCTIHKKDKTDALTSESPKVAISEKDTTQSNRRKREYRRVKKKTDKQTLKKTKRMRKRTSDSLFDRKKRDKGNLRIPIPRREEITYSSFAEVPANILLVAMVKEDSAIGYKFARRRGKEKITDFIFGNVFNVLPRTDSWVVESLDSLIRWVPLRSEGGEKIWIQTDKLLIRRQAYIPTGSSVSFYKYLDDNKPRISYSNDDVAGQVVIFNDRSIDSSGNIRIQTSTTIGGENQPGKWLYNHWVADSSLEPWLDEIVQRAIARFRGSGRRGDWEFTPEYDRNYWKHKPNERVGILFDKLISKYKPTIADSIEASKHMRKYYLWHFIYARQYEGVADNANFYSILESFAEEAEGYSKNSTVDLSQKWSVASANSREQMINRAIKDGNRQKALEHINKNIEYHADLPDISYEYSNTFGVAAMIMVRYRTSSIGFNEDSIAVFCENVPSLTKSPAVNAVALLIRAEIAEKKKQFLKADSLYLKTAELYPLADGYFYKSHVNWAHTALHRWSVAPIIREGNYDESFKRLSTNVNGVKENFYDLLSLISCNLKKIKGDDSYNEWDECLAISNDRKAFGNVHVSRFNSLTESFPMNRYAQPYPIRQRKDAKPIKGWFIKAPNDLTLYKLPHIPTESKIITGTKAQLLLRASYGFFPDLWIKIQLPDSTIGWIKSDGTAEYRGFME